MLLNPMIPNFLPAKLLSQKGAATPCSFWEFIDGIVEYGSTRVQQRPFKTLVTRVLPTKRNVYLSSGTSYES